MAKHWFIPWTATEVLEMQLHKPHFSSFPGWLVLGDCGIQQSSNSWVFLIFKVRQRHKEWNIPAGYRNKEPKYGGIPCSPSAGAPQQEPKSAEIPPSWEAGQERWQHGKGRRKTTGGVGGKPEQRGAGGGTELWQREWLWQHRKGHLCGRETQISTCSQQGCASSFALLT